MLHARGETPEGYATINTLALMYTESIGEWARSVFMIGAFAVLFSTVFSALAAWTRVFTDGEQRYCDSRGRGRGQSYAARFAAKEAVMKALRVGWGRDAAWHEIEVVRARGAAPHLVLSGSAAATARRLGIARWSLSLTHAANLAVAFVVAEDGA